MAKSEREKLLKKIMDNLKERKELIEEYRKLKKETNREQEQIKEEEE